MDSSFCSYILYINSTQIADYFYTIILFFLSNSCPDACDAGRKTLRKAPPHAIMDVVRGKKAEGGNCDELQGRMARDRSQRRHGRNGTPRAERRVLVLPRRGQR